MTRLFRLFAAALAVVSPSLLKAQTYTQMQWGMNKGVNPYAFGANINGTWRDLGTVSAAGAWTLSPSALIVSGPTTFSNTVTFTGDLFNKGNKIVSIFNYAACNGVADDSAGFLAAAASNKNILIPANASCKISTNTTVPNGSAWSVEKGGVINVTTGVTLKMRAQFNAGRYKIFNGVGSVVGIAQSKPDWWGVNGAFGNTFDSQPAFQAAVNSASQAFDPSDPANYSDTEGAPSVDIGFGFYNFCTPVNVYPLTSRPFKVRGSSWALTVVQTCSSFTGYAPFLVHGFSVGSGNVWGVTFEDMTITNPVKASGATAGIRFVPEGDGYWLQALQKTSEIKNVSIGNFPINLDLVNTVQLKISRSYFVASGANISNNVGIRMYASGLPANGNQVGELTLEDNNFDLCPLANAAGCTNTTGVDIQSYAGAALGAFTFRKNIFYSSNNFVKMLASGANSWVSEIWFADDGNQFDGFGCSFIDARSELGASVFDIHVNGVYHTGASSASCIAHRWVNDGASSMFNIWDINNHFVMGTTGPIISMVFVSNSVVTGNMLNGTNAAVDAISVALSDNVVVSNNVLRGTWRYGISLDPNTTNSLVQGNACNSAGFLGQCIIDAASPTTNAVYGNSDRKFNSATFTGITMFDNLLKLKDYTVAGLPTCNAGATGAVAYVTDATAPTYNGALTGGGAVVVPVFCNGAAWSSH